jgi:hypothetical protein
MLSDVLNIKHDDGEWKKADFIASMREIFELDLDWAKNLLHEITRYHSVGSYLSYIELLLTIDTARSLLHLRVLGLSSKKTLIRLPHEKHPGLTRAPAQTDVSRREAHEAREDRRSGP